MLRLLVLDVESVLGDGQDLTALGCSLYVGCGPAAPSWSRKAAALIADRVVSKLDILSIQDGTAMGIVALSGERAEEVAQLIGVHLQPGPRATLHGDLLDGLETCAGWLEGSAADVVFLVLEDAYSVAVLTLTLPDMVGAGHGYALIDAATSTHGSVDGGVRSALAQAGLSPSDIGYLETVPWPPDPALAAAFGQHEAGGLTCALGSLAGTIDRNDSSEALADPAGQVWVTALLKVLLSIYKRTLYPAPGSLPDAKSWERTSLYVVPETRPWFRQNPEQPRRAMYLHHSSSGETLCVVLSEQALRRPAVLVETRIKERDCVILPVAGETAADIMIGLQDIQRRLANGETEASLMDRLAAAYQAQQGMPLAVALIGHSRSDIAQEVVRALKGVEQSFVSGKDWVTPRGSAFSPQPLGGDGVTLVYPGAFNAYIGLGRDLFQYFPFLHEAVEEVLPDLHRVTAADYIYPRERTALTEEMVRELKRALAQDSIALIESGTTFALAYTEILRRVFRVQVQYALGYSLGEASMLWSLRVWQGGARASEILRSLPLFKTSLAGPRLAVRKAWGLGVETPLEWATYVLKAPVEDVKAAVATESRVYITLVNLVNEVVIAGEAGGCRRVIDSLGCHALSVPFNTVIHNEVVRTEYDQLLVLYDHAVGERPDITFFSAADYSPLVLEREALARAMAEMSCQTIDFPRLVERAYEEGARVFVEVGPQATSTRRITRILKGKPHAAVSMDPTGADDLQGVLGAVARLIAHRVPVDLSALRGGEVRPVPIMMPARSSVGVSDTSFSKSVLRGDAEVVLNKGAGHGMHSKVERLAAGSIPFLEEVSRRFGDHQSRLAQLQRAFLTSCGEFQEAVGRLIHLQCQVADRQVTGRSGTDAALLGEKDGIKAQPRFDTAALEAFATGDPVDCFGEMYAAHRGRRLPRIPNGDLLLMSRVINVSGEPGIFDDSCQLRSAYDVPTAAWYYGGAYRSLPPYFVLMEMGLQPCGFLSAYLGSAFLSSEQDLYFRNLDGRGQVLAELDLRGETVECECRLLSTTRSRDVILQTFEFALYAVGQRFFEGWASFGYFPRRMLQEQKGLSHERVSARMGHGNLSSRKAIPVALDPGLGSLQLLQSLHVTGVDGDRLVVGSGKLSPEDWFFKAHFHEDPVMPGSLGVEGMAQALRVYGRWRYPEFAGAAVSYPHGVTTHWKYRGQVTPADTNWQLEVRVTTCRQEGDGLLLVGDGTFWKDDLCIYEVRGLAVRLDC